MQPATPSHDGEALAVMGWCGRHDLARSLADSRTASAMSFKAIWTLSLLSKIISA